MNLLLSPINLSVHHFSSLLQSCLKLKLLQPCKQIHAAMLTSSLNMNVLSLNSKLVAAYASCGDLDSAESIFQRIKNPNVFAFNWMISSLAFNHYPEKAIGYFSLLQKSGIFPNNHTFCIVLKACLGLRDLGKEKEVHCVMYRLGFELDLSVYNALIDFYCKFGNISYARKVFDEMPVRDVATWTSMVYGYLSAGDIEESFILFERMKLDGLNPNEFTWNAMISAYAKRGDRDAVLVLLSKMSKEGMTPDLVTWNAMISGFVQSQRYDEALELLEEMLGAHLYPNESTVTSLLTLCGSIGSVKTGKEIHGLIYRMDIQINVFVASALIDMYAKCGMVKDSWNAFATAPSKNSASWNSMIGCFGKHGVVDSAITLFEKMQCEGVQATELTFTSLLSACSHSGLVEKGLEIFRSMEKTHSIHPRKEHYACVVDLLCRVGRIEDAYEIIKEMPVEVTESIVGAFFNGCRVHERKDLAEMLADGILKMELKRPGGFVCLSNVYAAEGEWEKVEAVRRVMKSRGLSKMPGSSWL